MKTTAKIMAVFLVVLALSAGNLRAEIIIVDNDWPYDFNNIQAAINYSTNGDTVLVAPGTYTGPGNRDIDFLGKAITVRSESGPENCIIDCNGTKAEPHRGFYFHSGEDKNSIVDGLTITNGYGPKVRGGPFWYWIGGGIYCHGSNPTIMNCVIKANSAKDYGGGMYNGGHSSPTITSCIFSGNSAAGGGGMHNSKNSTPTLTNCTFSENAGGSHGGGMYNIDSSPTLINCTFSGNWGRHGGGVASHTSHNSTAPCNLTLTNCAFSRNWADQSGGGMYSYHASATLTNCTFSGNSAGNRGGGMYNHKTSPSLTNCTFSDNSADYGGGMYNWNQSDATLSNCTFTGNWADSGGAICNRRESNPILRNCILWGNTASQGDSISLLLYNWAGYTFTAAISVGYSDVEGGYEGVYAETDCTVNWGEGNIDLDPCFVEPGYWGDANDPNIIVEPNDPNAVWIDGDYYLLPDSPCIDSGDNNSVPADIHDLDGDGNTAEPLPFDLDGNPRFVDRLDIEDTGNGTPPIVDMGAYEAMVSCFGVNHVKLGTKAGKKGSKVEVKGTFDPASPIDFAVDDVTYTIDDGLDYMLTFVIPAGSFEQEGKPDKQKFRFHSAKGSQPDIKARFDFLKCKFELKVKGVIDTSEITAETLAIVLQAGANIAQEIVELEVKGKKGEHLEYKRKPKLNCCQM